MAVDLGYDEGGAGDILLVSMQLGMTDKSKRMKKLWKKELSKVGIPYFHSVDFKNFSGGIFRDLDQPKRAKLLECLGELIRLRLEVGISTHVNERLYKTNTRPDFRSKWASPYTFAIWALVLGAHAYLKEFDLGFDVNVLIEDGHRNSRQALDMFETLKNAPESDDFRPLKILTVGLGSKKDHPILQAADMLAYSEWQKIAKGNMDIYDSLHVDGSRYETRVVDCDEIGLVGNLKDSVARYEERRRSWGERKALRKNGNSK